MFSVEGVKHLRDRAVLDHELVNHILKVFLAMSPSEKFFPYPRTEESGVGDSEFIGHDFVLPCSLPHHREYTGWPKCPVNAPIVHVDSKPPALHHRLILTRGLGGNLRIVCRNEGNCSFLICNLRHSSFLQSSGFIGQAADGGSGDPVFPRYFRQAQTG
jgi:hypothetical protein